MKSQPGTMQNHKTQLGTMKNQPGAMKNHENGANRPILDMRCHYVYILYYFSSLTDLLRKRSFFVTNRRYSRGDPTDLLDV